MGAGVSGLELGVSFALEPAGALFATRGSAAALTFRLSDAYAFIFVARGELAVAAEKSITPLSACEALLLQRTSGTVVLSPGEGAEVYALKFRAGHGTRGAASSLSLPARGYVANPERLTDLVRRYVSEQRRRGSSPWGLYNLLVLILCEFSAAAGDARGGRPAGSGLETIASMVDEYVAAHYREPIGTHDVARELRYSPGYLERAYRRERGISVRSAIHLRRIKEARAQLLLQRERNVSDIAAQCGYGDVAYFRRVFKRATNMTPVRFRAVNLPRAG